MRFRTSCSASDLSSTSTICVPNFWKRSSAGGACFTSLLLAAEKLTIKAADLVVCANDTYREIAIARGGKRPEDVVAVYSVPRQGFIRRVEPDETLRRGARIVIGYMGVIADQDGVDHFIQMMDCLVNDLGRKRSSRCRRRRRARARSPSAISPIGLDCRTP